jgi:dolichyl-phosphate-mannose-protein mannosyltransferase
MNTTVEEGFDPLINTPIRHVNDALLIRLEHTITKKKLHSHDVRPTVSEVDWQNEVSGYGFEGFDGDANDHWVVEIEKDWTDKGDKQAKKRLKALRTKFRLRHLYTGCYLFSHKVKLPDWGFEQQEVTCNKNPTKANSLWFIETNEHPLCLSIACSVSRAHLA